MRVLLVRADSTPDDDARALKDHGIEVTADAYIHVKASDDSQAGDRARQLIATLMAEDSWLVLTSAAGMRSLDALLGSETVSASLQAAQSGGSRFAAVGPTSASALTDHGISQVLIPRRAHTASALLELLDDVTPGTAVMPRSSIANPDLARTLESRGWTVISAEVYRTETVAERPSTASALATGDFDAVVLRSPSAARAVAHFADVPASTAVVAGGPTTALEAERLGLRVAAVSADSQARSIAEAVVTALHSRIAAH